MVNNVDIGLYMIICYANVEMQPLKHCFFQNDSMMIVSEFSGTSATLRLLTEMGKNRFQKWVRIIKSIKNFNNFKGQPHTYLVQKQYKYLLELAS